MSPSSRLGLALLFALAPALGGCSCFKPSMSTAPAYGCSDRHRASTTWVWPCENGQRVLVVRLLPEGPVPPRWHKRVEACTGDEKPESYVDDNDTCAPGPAGWSD